MAPHHLSGEQRIKLTEQLLEFNDSAGTFLDKLGARVEDLGVELPSVQIEYRDLNVTTTALIGSAGIPTVISPIQYHFKVCIIGMQ